jgi:ribosomal protein S18 acetylase RimI-like enzyme
MLEHPDDAERYGIDWNGILLHGAPGVGKTFFARAIAGGPICSLLHVSTGDLVASLVGGWARNIEKAFETAGKHPDVEAEVVRLGLSARSPLPGMTASPDELADAPSAGLEIARVEDEKGLAEAARVAAAGGGVPEEFLLPLYAPAVLGLAGFSVYLGRVDEEAVTTAIGFQTDEDVAIFSVGTPPQHRRRGYGGAVTARAARAGFDNGADLAWLQTSEMAEPLYRQLGFRHVQMHHLLGRP